MSMFTLYRAPFFLPWIYPELTWSINTPDKEIYLTFDDGPVPGPTEFVLGELARFSAQATFFCIGDNVRKHPALFRKIVASGHMIGNHTFNHLSGWKTSSEKYLNNVKQCQEEFDLDLPRSGIERPLGGYPRLFRPPYGRIKRRQIQQITDYKIVMWDVLTHDYSHSLNKEACLAGSIKATRSGSIVVFHDSLKAEKNMTYVLPRFMEHFSKLGYVFKSLS
jgi:peptidoglycan/xylan/chitin deacetylase (PgdA/CDA1 family)